MTYFNNINQIMKNQPIINVGMIGHVANGKTTLTSLLTGVGTQKFSSEKEKNITVRLGYANVKIWKCTNCNDPESFDCTNSSVMDKQCKYCNHVQNLVNHISIIDCPGHNMLTSTMLNGSSVMDYTILVESFTNDAIPAPQTSEHYLATMAAEIPTSIIVMNKIDVVNRETSQKKIKMIQEFIQNETNGLNIPPIVPISATFKKNIDVICEYLSQLKIPLKHDHNDKFKMIVIRSFDINKPGIDVRNLNGGVIGGTIISGTLKIGDKINIYPGLCKRIPEKEKSGYADFKYNELVGEVLSIQSDKNNLDYAISGGLLGIQLTIDPAYTRNDILMGSLVLKHDDIINDVKNSDDRLYKVYEKIIVIITKFLMDKQKIHDYLIQDTNIKLNINSNNIESKISQYSKSNFELKLELSKPIAITTDKFDKMKNYITIMTSGINNIVLGRGTIIGGIECINI